MVDSDGLDMLNTQTIMTGFNNVQMTDVDVIGHTGCLQRQHGGMILTLSIHILGTVVNKSICLVPYAKAQT